MKSVFFSVLFITCLSIYGQYIEVGPFSGAVNDSSATVIFKISEEGQKCRLIYSRDSLLNNPFYSDILITSRHNANYVKIQLSELMAETKYFYLLELNGERIENSRGAFKTFSNSAQSFKFCFGNSLRTETHHSGLMAAIENDILFFLNTGDLHYDDIGTADIGMFRNSYQKAFLRNDMSAMGKKVPFIYVWDDHDYGPNNSDKTAPGRLQSGKAYRECIPHYPLPAPEENGAIYQAFTVNNVRFMMTDLRSKRDVNHKPDTEDKSMMGKVQRKWFLHELKQSASRYPLVIWVNSVPFTAEKKEGGDNWNGFTTERKTIANFIQNHQIENLMIISGDAHSVAYNQGLNNCYADEKGEGIFEILAAPLDNNVISRKGGPWTEVYLPEKGQNVYGMVEIEHNANKITVHFKAFDTHNRKVLHATKIFKVDIKD